MYSTDLCKVKLATLVEGDSKAPFSIATKTSCSGGHYSIPLLPNFSLYPYLHTAEC